MVSYGFEEIEDFYLKSSTRGVVGNVKIPVLFIQVHIFVLQMSNSLEFCMWLSFYSIFEYLISFIFLKLQNDDSTAPLFSIPRSSIAENPFTSLLLCSCVPSNSTASGRAVVSWCQNLTIEVTYCNLF